jgi:hypothetical protein
MQISIKEVEFLTVARPKAKMKEKQQTEGYRKIANI